MLGGVTGVLVLVAGVLVVLLIAGVALVLHVRQRRRRPPEASRTSWPRATTAREDPAQPSWWQDSDAPQRDGSPPEGATARIPLARGPVDRGPIDSEKAQKDPETIIARLDPPDGTVFPPPRR